MEEQTVTAKEVQKIVQPQKVEEKFPDVADLLCKLALTGNSLIAGRQPMAAAVNFGLRPVIYVDLDKAEYHKYPDGENYVSVSSDTVIKFKIPGQDYYEHAHLKYVYDDKFGQDYLCLAGSGCIMITNSWSIQDCKEMFEQASGVEVSPDQEIAIACISMKTNHAFVISAKVAARYSKFCTELCRVNLADKKPFVTVSLF